MVLLLGSLIATVSSLLVLAAIRLLVTAILLLRSLVAISLLLLVSTTISALLNLLHLLLRLLSLGELASDLSNTGLAE